MEPSVRLWRFDKIVGCASWLAGVIPGSKRYMLFRCAAAVR